MILGKTCRTCAYLRRSTFLKRSKQYGRVIWWCKKSHEYSGSRPLHYRLLGCEEWISKEERKKLSDEITRRIRGYKFVKERNW